MSRALACVALMPILVAACSGMGGSRGPQFLSSPSTRAQALPFSEAVRADSLLFVSGQIGNRPGRPELVPGGIQPETRQALENVRAILERNGSGMDQVVKCTVFLADITDWPAFNEIYVEFFPADRLPARSALATGGLALGARVEVECIAMLAEPS